MLKTQFDSEKIDGFRPVSLIFRIASGFIVFICIFSTYLQLFTFALEKYTALWWLILIVNSHGIWIFSHIVAKGLPPTYVKKFLS